MKAAFGVRLRDLNPHLVCVLCGGYLINATTIQECLHSFCRSCILRYLESCSSCPICDVTVHVTKPHCNIREDKVLQNLVYKLVPGLFYRERDRRKEFFENRDDTNSETDSSSSDEAEESDAMVFSSNEIIHHDFPLELEQDGTISVCLQLCDRAPPYRNSSSTSSPQRDRQTVDRRFLQCPAKMPVSSLKKFIQAKFQLSKQQEIDVYFSEEKILDDCRLMDVAYLNHWKRMEPLKIFYTVTRAPEKNHVTVTSQSASLPEKQKQITTSTKCTSKSSITTHDSKTIKNEKRGMDTKDFPCSIPTVNNPKQEQAADSKQQAKTSNDKAKVDRTQCIDSAKAKATASLPSSSQISDGSGSDKPSSKAAALQDNCIVSLADDKCTVAAQEKIENTKRETVASWRSSTVSKIEHVSSSTNGANNLVNPPKQMMAFPRTNSNNAVNGNNTDIHTQLSKHESRTSGQANLDKSGAISTAVTKQQHISTSSLRPTQSISTTVVANRIGWAPNGKGDDKMRNTNDKRQALSKTVGEIKATQLSKQTYVNLPNKPSTPAVGHQMKVTASILSAQQTMTSSVPAFCGVTSFASFESLAAKNRPHTSSVVFLPNNETSRCAQNAGSQNFMTSQPRASTSSGASTLTSSNVIPRKGVTLSNSAIRMGIPSTPSVSANQKSATVKQKQTLPMTSVPGLQRPSVSQKGILNAVPVDPTQRNSQIAYAASRPVKASHIVPNAAQRLQLLDHISGANVLVNTLGTTANVLGTLNKSPTLLNSAVGQLRLLNSAKTPTNNLFHITGTLKPVAFIAKPINKEDKTTIMRSAGPGSSNTQAKTVTKSHVQQNIKHTYQPTKPLINPISVESKTMIECVDINFNKSLIYSSTQEITKSGTTPTTNQSTAVTNTDKVAVSSLDPVSLKTGQSHLNVKLVDETKQVVAQNPVISSDEKAGIVNPNDNLTRNAAKEGVSCSGQTLLVPVKVNEKSKSMSGTTNLDSSNANSSNLAISKSRSVEVQTEPSDPATTINANTNENKMAANKPDLDLDSSPRSPDSSTEPLNSGSGKRRKSVSLFAKKYRSPSKRSRLQYRSYSIPNRETKDKSHKKAIKTSVDPYSFGADDLSGHENMSIDKPTATQSTHKGTSNVTDTNTTTSGNENNEKHETEEGNRNALAFLEDYVNLVHNEKDQTIGNPENKQPVQRPMVHSSTRDSTGQDRLLSPSTSTDQCQTSVDTTRFPGYISNMVPNRTSTSSKRPNALIPLKDIASANAALQGRINKESNIQSISGKYMKKQSELTMVNTQRIEKTDIQTSVTQPPKQSVKTVDDKERSMEQPKQLPIQEDDIISTSDANEKTANEERIPPLKLKIQSPERKQRKRSSSSEKVSDSNESDPNTSAVDKKDQPRIFLRISKANIPQLHRSVSADYTMAGRKSHLENAREPTLKMFKRDQIKYNSPKRKVLATSSTKSKSLDHSPRKSPKLNKARPKSIEKSDTCQDKGQTEIQAQGQSQQNNDNVKGTESNPCTSDLLDKYVQPTSTQTNTHLDNAEKQRNIGNGKCVTHSIAVPPKKRHPAFHKSFSVDSTLTYPYTSHMSKINAVKEEFNKHIPQSGLELLSRASEKFSPIPEAHGKEPAYPETEDISTDIGKVDDTKGDLKSNPTHIKCNMDSGRIVDGVPDMENAKLNLSTEEVTTLGKVTTEENKPFPNHASKMAQTVNTLSKTESPTTSSLCSVASSKVPSTVFSTDDSTAAKFKMSTIPSTALGTITSTGYSSTFNTASGVMSSNALRRVLGTSPSTVISTVPSTACTSSTLSSSISSADTPSIIQHVSSTASNTASNTATHTSPSTVPSTHSSTNQSMTPYLPMTSPIMALGGVYMGARHMLPPHIAYQGLLYPVSGVVMIDNRGVNKNQAVAKRPNQDNHIGKSTTSKTQGILKTSNSTDVSQQTSCITLHTKEVPKPTQAPLSAPHKYAPDVPQTKSRGVSDISPVLFPFNHMNRLENQAPISKRQRMDAIGPPQTMVPSLSDRNEPIDREHLSVLSNREQLVKETSKTNANNVEAPQLSLSTTQMQSNVGITYRPDVLNEQIRGKITVPQTMTRAMESTNQQSTGRSSFAYSSARLPMALSTSNASQSQFAYNANQPITSNTSNVTRGQFAYNANQPITSNTSNVTRSQFAYNANPMLLDAHRLYSSLLLANQMRGESGNVSDMRTEGGKNANGYDAPLALTTKKNDRQMNG